MIAFISPHLIWAGPNGVTSIPTVLNVRGERVAIIPEEENMYMPVFIPTAEKVENELSKKINFSIKDADRIVAYVGKTHQSIPYFFAALRIPESKILFAFCPCFTHEGIERMLAECGYSNSTSIRLSYYSLQGPTFDGMVRDYLAKGILLNRPNAV